MVAGERRAATLVQRMNAPVRPPEMQSVSNDADDATRLEILRLLTERPQLSQRELARALGFSLGKTHYVLRALLERGLVKASNFRRSDRKMAYAYLLTAAGLREKIRLTRAFLSRKEAEFERLQATIVKLRAEVAGLTHH